jgi:hypothetical protein
MRSQPSLTFKQTTIVTESTTTTTTLEQPTTITSNGTVIISQTLTETTTEPITLYVRHAPAYDRIKVLTPSQVHHAELHHYSDREQVSPICNARSFCFKRHARRKVLYPLELRGRGPPYWLFLGVPSNSPSWVLQTHVPSRRPWTWLAILADQSSILGDYQSHAYTSRNPFRLQYWNLSRSCISPRRTRSACFRYLSSPSSEN